jgi:ATP-dependent DNA ligase
VLGRACSESDNWLHEIKYDGYRLQIRLNIEIASNHLLPGLVQRVRRAEP